MVEECCGQTGYLQRITAALLFRVLTGGVSIDRYKVQRLLILQVQTTQVSPTTVKDTDSEYIGQSSTLSYKLLQIVALVTQVIHGVKWAFTEDAMSNIEDK